MPNRVYTDLSKLLREVNDLIDRGQVRVHRPARRSHPELTELEQIAVVRYGGRPRPDRGRPESEGVYACWATLSNHGVCRAVFSVEVGEGGDIVLVITAFAD